MKKQYKAAKDGSYLHNYHLERRQDDPSRCLFASRGAYDSVTVCLNGYAIIPLERYVELAGLKREQFASAEDIAEADRQLHGSSEQEPEGK